MSKKRDGIGLSIDQMQFWNGSEASAITSSDPTDTHGVESREIENFVLSKALQSGIKFATPGENERDTNVLLPTIEVAEVAPKVHKAAIKSIGVFQSEVGATGQSSSSLAHLDGEIINEAYNPTHFPLFEMVEHVETCGCAACHNGQDDRSEAGDAVSGETSGNLGILSDMADFLLTGYWNTGYGDGSRSHNVTDTGIDANNGVLHYNLSGYGADSDGVTAERAFLIREAFKLFEATLGIEFVETTSTDSSFVDFFFRDNDGGAYASSGYWNSGQWGSTITSAQINVAASWSGGTSTYDDYTFQTILHEIGHAMGLGHQGSYNGSATYGTDNVFDNDNWQTSMMSYFSQTQATAVDASYEFLQTPMVADWLALDVIYGRQGYGVSNAFTEDTTWGFNTNITADISDVWATWSDWGNRTASTIVDGGGIDTLDLSGYANNTLINLAPSDLGGTAPSSSDIGGRIGNLTIAVGTVIENAIGGAGSETFIGNDADNILVGNGGDDTFIDSLGSDRYNGGEGNDFVEFALAFADYTYSIVGGILQVIDTAIDWVESTVEWLTFSDQTLSWQAIADGTSSNETPTVNPDFFSVEEDQVLAGSGILGNDTDPDGDSLSVASVEGVVVNSNGTTVTLASGATLTMFRDGTFEYDQNGAFDGLTVGQTATDSFSYTATDGFSQSGNTTVQIEISGAFDNSAPIAVADSFNVSEDDMLSGSGILSNDIDADGDLLSVALVEGVQVESAGTSVTLASGAMVTMFANGTFEYDQNGAFDSLEIGQTATDQFTYRVTDGESVSNEATINIEIAGAFDNSAPDAVNDAFRLDEDGTTVGSVLINDTDANGDALLVSAVNGSAQNIGVIQTLASGATLILNADGTFSYDTNGAYDSLEDGETATDTFSYSISDGQGGLDTAQVTMTIDGQSPPMEETAVLVDFETDATGPYMGANNLTFSGLEVVSSTQISGARLGSTGSNGDFSISATNGSFDLNSLSLISASGRQKVLIQAYADGILVGNLQTNVGARNAKNVSFDVSFDGIDEVVITGTSELFVDEIALITSTPIDPDGNLAPVAENDALDTSEAGTVQGNLLANDSDPNGDVLSLLSIEGDETGPVTLTSGATVTFQPNGDVTYDPNGAFDELFDGQTATDSFTYIVSDGQGGHTQAMATISIAGSGIAPSLTVVDFETATQSTSSTVTDGVYIFSDAALTEIDPGVTSGNFALESLGTSLSVIAEGGDTFDFVSGMVTISGKGRDDVLIEGYLDGTLVGSETIRIRANKETSLSPTDAAFDEIDELVISSTRGVTVDDLNFLS